jgi:tetratricopeptide (TPR) repeat protein
MKWSNWFFAAAACLALVADARAIDIVKKFGSGRASGTLKSITANEVSIEVSGKVEKIPANDVESIEFDGEPSELKLARGALRTGNDKSVITNLDKIKIEPSMKPGVKQDIAFYRAYANARAAMSGSGDIQKAGQEMFNFASGNAESYHFYQAQETLGELLVAVNKIDDAIKVYSVLDQSPSDIYKMRAASARGRALMSLSKFPEALAEFDKVLALPFNPMTQKGTQAESQRFSAVLGKAQCQAKTGGYEEAIKQLEGTIIANLNPEESALQALAYNTLGNCYNQKPDGKKNALLAFLHTDVLYNNVPSAHAEALWNLSQLWIDIGKNERGQECLNRLNRLYPGSPWLSKKR